MASPASIEDETKPGETPGFVLALDRERGLEIRLARGSVSLQRVRPGGRNEMSAFAYANGARLKPGMRLPVKVAR